MISRTLTKFFFAIFIVVAIVLIASLWLIQPIAFAHPPYIDATPVGQDFKNAKYLKDPCEKQPNNMVTNGGMGPDASDTSYGTVATGWTPFIFNGAPPNFRVVFNEGTDGISQQIYGNGTFDAGVYQTVGNLQSGSYYWFRLGKSLAAKDYGGGNTRVDSIGRKVGVDPFGGTDPKSPNVIWGPDYFNGVAATNILEMILVFPARSDRATFFLRGMATDGSSGENRVWFDSVCMEARPELGTAAPLQPTANITPSPTATRPAPTRPPATRVVLAPTNTPTRIVEELRAPDTATPTVVVALVAAPSATPRFARPDVTPSSGSSIDFGAGIFIGIGVILIMSALLFFGIGFIWWHRTR